MKKTILLILFLTFVFGSSVYANEVKCKIYDIVCKAQKFASDTKEYQINAWKKDSSKVQKEQKKQ